MKIANNSLPDWSNVGARVIVIRGRSPRLADRILAINSSLKDRLRQSDVDELAAGSSKLEPRLACSNTLELRRRPPWCWQLESGVLDMADELRREERSELRDSVLELRRRVPCEVATKSATISVSMISVAAAISIWSGLAGTWVRVGLKQKFYPLAKYKFIIYLWNTAEKALKICTARIKGLKHKITCLEDTNIFCPAQASQ